MIKSKHSVLQGLYIRRICAVFVAAALMLCTTACKSNPSGDSSSGISGSAVSSIDSENDGIESGNSSLGSDSDSAPTSNTSSGAQSQDKTTGSKDNGKTNSNSNVDVKGYTFTIISTLLPTKQSSNNTLFEKLLFERIEEVEKELGCTIKIVNSLSVTPSTLAPMIQAGKKVGDIMEVEMRYLPALLAKNYLQPWDNVSGINIKDAKYTESYTRLATINGKTWGLQFMKPPEVRYCVVVNKTLLGKMGIDADNIYKMINNKTWDFETFATYAKAATAENGSTWGVGGRPEYVTEMLIAANNGKLVTQGSNGKATATYTSNQVINAMNFFDRLVNKDKSFMVTDGMRQQSTFETQQPDYINSFIQGKIAFLFEDSWTLEQKIKPRVKNFDYGMIMIPKGPDATDYVSPAEHARVFVLSTTNKADLAKTSKIFNALAEPPSGYGTDDWWLDDVQLSYFQNNDTESIKMYKKSLDNSTWDLGMGIDSLSTGFKKEAVYKPIFWNTSGLTPKAAIEGIAGKYDAAIKAVYN